MLHKATELLRSGESILFVVFHVEVTFSHRPRRDSFLTHDIKRRFERAAAESEAAGKFEIFQTSERTEVADLITGNMGNRHVFVDEAWVDDEAEALSTVLR